MFNGRKQEMSKYQKMTNEEIVKEFESVTATLKVLII